MMKRKPVARDWTPVKRGAVFCSPACGGGCTHASFLKAHSDAAMLCETLAKTTAIKTWRPNVWENLGWHCNAISGCGRLKVHPSENPTSFTAFLGKANEGGGKWAEHGKTPKAAVSNVILVAKNQLAEVGAIITDL